ncbi:MAG: 2-oxo acid dehydrogenase subunit E2 [Lachnospiraceae bacterium]|nr:2-oxo acid dehydrogenase subunit E2 [Lachnospiraceae bacterium]
MWGNRPDGRRIRNVDPMQLITGFLMKKRYDSMTMYEDSFNCEAWDTYIKEKEAQGIKLGYMHIFIAGVVRMLALKPRLNRFVMNGKIYARPKIWVSFTIHPELHIDSPDTTIKLCFEGTETILEIAEAINNAIRKETILRSEENDTDKLARFLTAMPSSVLNVVAGVLMWMDRHNMMPKSIIEFSPFHTSFYITNLKSLGINHVFHHTCEFGTNGLFFAMGKEKQVPVVEKGEVVIQKHMPFSLVSDERFCDGLYYALALRELRKIMRNPVVLEEPLAQKVEDVL